MGWELERHGTTDVAWDDLGRIGMWGGSKLERVRTSPRSAMRATMRAAPTRKCQTLRCGWLFDTFSYQTCKIRHDLSLDMRTLGILGGNLWWESLGQGADAATSERLGAASHAK